MLICSRNFADHRSYLNTFRSISWKERGVTGDSGSLEVDMGEICSTGP